MKTYHEGERDARATLMQLTARYANAMELL